VFLLRQHVGRGIVASGHLADGDVFEAPHCAAAPASASPATH
jgi:hypothetical protein